MELRRVHGPPATLDSNTKSAPPLDMAFTALNNRAVAPTVPIPMPAQVPAQAQAPAPVPAPTSVPASAPHPQEIDVAFAGNKELRKRVHAAIGTPILSDPPSHRAIY